MKRVNLGLRFPALLSCILFAACNDDSRLPSYDLAGRTMGTTFNVSIVSPAPDTDLEDLQVTIQDKLEHIENLASTYRPDSELSRFNASLSTDWLPVSSELCSMVAAVQEISLATDGAFDVTVGPLVNLWGFGPSVSKYAVPTDAEIAAARQHVGHLKLLTNCNQSTLRKTVAGVYVDLSAWAKGYAVDEIADLLDAREFTSYLVEIGGELRARGHNTERRKFAIAIEIPSQVNAVDYSIVRLTNVAVATSGDYRNFFDHDGQRFSHTIDPRTGWPVKHDMTGVTVVAASAAYADAMATALLVAGPDDAQALAEKLDLAAYFLVRTEHGIEEQSTRRFDKLTQQSEN